MSAVAIVFPPIRVSRDFIDYPYFADLGAVQAAAVLRAAGHEVTLVDALAMPGATLTDLEANGDPGYVLLGAPLAAALARVPEGAEAIVIALTPFHRPPARDPVLARALEARRARHPRAPIVLADLYQSGQHVVDVPSAAILAAYPEVDALLRYEAEDALGPLVDRLVAAGRPATAFAEDGGEPSPLDAIPPPAWDLVDLEAYFAFHEAVVRGLGRPTWAFPIDGRSVPALTSRGCPYRCVHCSSNPTTRKAGELVAPKTQRRYSPEALDRLFGDLAARGARRIHLLDELVNVSERHFDAVVDLCERHDLRFEIPNGVRADHVRARHLERMKGRLTTLSVSAESGVQRVVTEVVDKDLDLGSIREVARLAQAAEVPLLVHFMIGLPGETRAEINGTLDFAMRLHEETGAWPSVQFATPLPGTRLARMAEPKRVLPVIDDYGPHFQRAPSMETEAASFDDLRRFRWTFDRRIEAMRGPKKVIMNVTYKCNNRCTFCATGTRTQFDGDLGRQRELLVKYRKLGVDLLDFDGGEPTLNPNLLALVGFARRIGYRQVNVTTNARMSSYPEFAERLVRSGVTSLLTSIHGPDAQTHAQNVGVAEAFDQTIAGVRNFVRFAAEAPAPVELGANITVTKSNHKKLRDVALLIEDLGLAWFNIQFLTPFGRATSSVCPDTAEAAGEVMRLIDALGARMKIQVINLPFCFMPGYEDNLMGDMLKLERHMLFVNNDEVNLFEYLRERRVKKEVCAGCPHAIFCGGFYELDDVPEPTWLIQPEDLVRPIAAEVPRPIS